MKIKEKSKEWDRKNKNLEQQYKLFLNMQGIAT